MVSVSGCARKNAAASIGATRPRNTIARSDTRASPRVTPVMVALLVGTVAVVVAFVRVAVANEGSADVLRSAEDEKNGCVCAAERAEEESAEVEKEAELFGRAATPEGIPPSGCGGGMEGSGGTTNPAASSVLPVGSCVCLLIVPLRSLRVREESSFCVDSCSHVDCDGFGLNSLMGVRALSAAVAEAGEDGARIVAFPAVFPAADGFT